jgi:hypothetical protein
MDTRFPRITPDLSLLAIPRHHQDFTPDLALLAVPR